MSSSFEVKGLKQLDDFLAAFPVKLQKGAVRAGLTAAGGVVRDEARARAPKKTGKMARSIRTGSPKVNQNGTISVKVRADPKAQHAFIAHWIEYGVSPHFIRAGDSGMSPRLLTRAANNGGTSDVATGAMKINGNFVTGTILHPGFAPRPFLRSALDTKAQEAVKAFAGRIQDYLKGKTGFTAPSLDEAA